VALVLDTGVIYAALDENDRDHGACEALIADFGEQLVIPVPVLVELEYWLHKTAPIDVWLAFAEDVHAGAFVLWHADTDLLLAAAKLQSRFSDLRLGFVDAAVFCTCETLGESKVATLDRRHFSVLRNAAGEALDLLPQ
jgi:hypothetical protein